MRVEALGKRHDADQVQTIIDFLVRAGWLRKSGRFPLPADMRGAGT